MSGFPPLCGVCGRLLEEEGEAPCSCAVRDDVTLHLGGARVAVCVCGREFQPIPGLTAEGRCLFCTRTAGPGDPTGE